MIILKGPFVLSYLLCDHHLNSNMIILKGAIASLHLFFPLQFKFQYDNT